MKKADLCVIGAGPGGYVAAIHAAEKGLSVICVEKGETLGGTCLNVGCIPSKTLLHSSEIYETVHLKGKEHGIITENLSPNLAAMMERKERVVAGLAHGVEFLFKQHKVEWVKGEGVFLNPKTLRVDNETIEATSYLIATGSRPIELPMLPFDEKRILSSTGALSLTEIPQKMVVIGGGVIGLELGSVYRRLGAEVEVIELLDRIIPTFDRELSKTMLAILKKQGMHVHLKSGVEGVKYEGERLVVTHTAGKAEADVVLVSVGRCPNVQGLEKAELSINQLGQIVVNGAFQTSQPHIYAIGDVIDGAMLAHKASEEGLVVVDHLVGDDRKLNYIAIPNVMYTWPEVASVGLSEERAQELNMPIQTAKVSMKSNARGRCTHDEEGVVKLVAHQSGRILGVHIIGAQASEIIGEGVSLVDQGMTVRELAYLPHAHPTFCETLKEVALSML